MMVLQHNSVGKPYIGILYNYFTQCLSRDFPLKGQSWKFIYEHLLIIQTFEASVFAMQITDFLLF